MKGKDSTAGKGGNRTWTGRLSRRKRERAGKKVGDIPRAPKRFDKKKSEGSLKGLGKTSAGAVGNLKQTLMECMEQRYQNTNCGEEKEMFLRVWARGGETTSYTDSERRESPGKGGGRPLAGSQREKSAREYQPKEFRKFLWLQVAYLGKRNGKSTELTAVA